MWLLGFRHSLPFKDYCDREIRFQYRTATKLQSGPVPRLISNGGNLLVPHDSIRINSWGHNFLSNLDSIYAYVTGV